MTTMHRLWRVLALLLSLFVAVGCAPPVGPATRLGSGTTLTTEGVGAARSASPLIPSSALARTAGPVSAVVTGTDEFTRGLSEARERERARISVESGGTISLDLASVSIAAAANAVLGEALSLAYVVDPSVSGTITLQTSTPLDRPALLDVFQTLLELNGATLERRGDVVAVVPTSEVTPTFVTPDDVNGAPRSIVVLPLSFISVTEMVRLLEPVVSPEAIVHVNRERNLILVTGSATEIETILEAVNLFDIDVLRGKSVAFFPLRAADPEAVSDELRLIFDSGEGGSLDGVVDFVPNERLGSVLVITSRARYITEAEDWIRRLDSSAGRARRTAQVYDLRNRTAIELAPIIDELLAAEEDDRGDESDILAVDGRPRVVPDDAKNALIVWGTFDEQDEIARLIESLDTTPAQVLIEATIAEVVLNDELNLGVRWFFESGNFSLRFSDLESGGAVAGFPGFSFLFGGNDAIVALNALSAITTVNVASTPSILVLDNREAELRVGDQVPVVTQTATDVSDPNAPVVNSVSYEDTGVLLKIKPRIGESGRVTMEIEQEVSDVVRTTSSGIDSPTISQRMVKTSVVVGTGETLALGGLVEDSQQTVDTAVPFLGELPVVGALFRNRADVAARTELLILITPRVIRDANEGRAITDEFRRQMLGPAELLKPSDEDRHRLRRVF